MDCVVTVSLLSVRARLPALVRAAVSTFPSQPRLSLSNLRRSLPLALSFPSIQSARTGSSRLHPALLPVHRPEPQVQSSLNRTPTPPKHDEPRHASSHCGWLPAQCEAIRALCPAATDDKRQKD